MDDRSAEKLIDICAHAWAVTTCALQEETMDPPKFKEFQSLWRNLVESLNDAELQLTKWPESVRRPITAIAQAVNEAGVGPGYGDIFECLRRYRIDQYGTAAWRAIIREIKPPLIKWASSLPSVIEPNPEAAATKATTASLDLVTPHELGLAMSIEGKTVQNRLGEAKASENSPPEPELAASGRNAARYSYAAIRPWLRDNYPRGGELPETYAEFRAKVDPLLKVRPNV